MATGSGGGADRADRSPVRPYALTGGRTARSAMPPETVVAAGDSPSSTRTPEAAEIVELCRPWCSLAELSAHLRLPLGVVRVLVEDLAGDDVVVLHLPSPASEHPDQLERALHELRKRI